MFPSDTSASLRPSWFKRNAFCLIAGVAVLIAAIDLSGWVFGYYPYSIFSPYLRNMAPWSVVMLTLMGFGISRLCAPEDEGGGRLSRIAPWIAFIGGAIPFIQLVEYFFNYEASAFDLFFFKDSLLQISTRGVLGRMVPQTATAGALVGFSIAALGSRRRGFLDASLAMAILGGLISLTALVGQAFGLRPFWATPDLVGMVLQTSIAVTALAYGVILYHARLGRIPVLMSRGAGGVLVRRLLFAAVLVPLAIAMMIALAYALGIFDLTVGISIFTILIVVAMVSLIHGVSEAVSEAEERRVENASRESRQELRAMEDRLLRASGAANLGIFSTTLPVGELNWNDQVREHFFFEHDERVEGAVAEARIHPEDRAKVQRAVERLVATHESYDIQYRTVNPVDPRDVKWIRTWGWVSRDRNGLPNRFDGITLDITDRVEVEQKLRQALNMRDDFLSIASHELKTPITSLKLQTQMTKRSLNNSEGDALSPEKVKRFVDQADRSVERLVRLVDDMLDISRISTGKLALTRDDFDLVQTVYEVADRFSVLFPRGNLAIETPDSLVVDGDRLRIEQVVTNLLTNAARYGEGKPVVLRLRREPSYAVVEVRDHGRGIAPEDHDRIFNRFERAISASEVSGMGLGLYIVREILQLHGGLIRVESAPGQGSTFTAYLPLAGGRD